MSSHSKLEVRYSKNPSFVSRKIADEFILVPIRQSAGDIDSIFAINEVAGRIWELIDGKRPVKDVCVTIADEFDVSLAEAQEDVVEFLQQLEQINAIEVV